MTSRILPREQWDRLSGTELETVWPVLDPDSCAVIVVEDGEQIVGCWAVLRYVHVEGIWIHPDYRKQVRVQRNLWKAMVEQVRAWGARCVWTAAITEDVKQLLEKAGAWPLPGNHYVLPVERIH